MRDRVLRWCIDKTSRLTAALYALQGVPVWRSFDGRVTPISEMTTDHLKNSVRMLMRQAMKEGTALPPVYIFMVQELAARHGRDEWPS